MITRFAPSPTGPLHLGHAFSALTAFDLAQAAGGTFLLRMDDIDRVRSKPEYEAMAFEDLRWLGLSWPEPVLRQSRSQDRFQQALKTLAELGLTYPCRCSRADIAAAAGAPQEGVPAFGPDGRLYPGTCRNRAMSDMGPGDAIRLNMAKAVERIGQISFQETGPERPGQHFLNPQAMISSIGDVVVARKEQAAAYHLSVVVDDTAQGVTLVTRGMDLFDATPIHVLLAWLLDVPIPAYHHHRLIRDEHGKRLAKRDDARAIAKYRSEGVSPGAIRAKVGL